MAQPAPYRHLGSRGSPLAPASFAASTFPPGRASSPAHAPSPTAQAIRRSPHSRLTHGGALLRALRETARRMKSRGIDIIAEMTGLFREKIEEL